MFLILSTVIIAYILLDTFWGDSSIYLVYAKNIAGGNLFSFNLGEFSSGATSPLWAMILSVGFLFGNGVLLSKIISLIFVILALLLTYKASVMITKSRIGSAIGVGFLWYFLAFSGILIYESGLTVSLISILLILNYFLIQKEKKSYIWALGVIWALLPLVRPESIIILFLNVFLVIFIYRKNKKDIYALITAFLVSLIPILIYFSYSYIETGVISASTYCRTFSLRSIAVSYPDSVYNSFYGFFTYPPVLMGFFMAIYGLVNELKQKKNDVYWLMFLFLTVLISFILIFTIYSPLNKPLDVQRYMIPAVPFIIPFISLGVSKLIKLSSKLKLAPVLVLFVILALVIVPPLAFAATYSPLSQMPLKFDDITEKNTVTYLNNVAGYNDTVLAFEVQDRYYLRPDLKILSLDGITDGKIAPFLSKEDIAGFLWKYKPRYWIANKAVYLPVYYSTLGYVVNKTGSKEGSSIKIDGITFKNIKVRNEPLNSQFWGCTQLYELSYDK